MTVAPSAHKLRAGGNAQIVYQIMLVLALVLLVAACDDDMAVQAKCPPLGAIQDFKDGACAQPLPEGVVARDTIVTDDALTTGKADAQYVTRIPVALSDETLKRGQDRYNVYCQPCHGAAGYGDGITTHYGFPAPPSFHSDALRAQPPGFFFDVISNGFGRMYPYATQLDVADRWAVVAYIQALQLSQHAPAAVLSPSEREQLAQ